MRTAIPRGLATVTTSVPRKRANQHHQPGGPDRRPFDPIVLVGKLLHHNVGGEQVCAQPQQGEGEHRGCRCAPVRQRQPVADAPSLGKICRAGRQRERQAEGQRLRERAPAWQTYLPFVGPPCGEQVRRPRRDQAHEHVEEEQDSPHCRDQYQQQLEVTRMFAKKETHHRCHFTTGPNACAIPAIGSGAPLH